MNGDKRLSNKGSIWRKWDLHIHTPDTRLSDNYSLTDSDQIWNKFIEEIESSDVAAFGITDYFSCANHFALVEKYHSVYPDSAKVLFPNIEFRLDIAVNKAAEEINLHVIFSNEVPKSKIEDFLGHIETNLTDEGSARISCKNLTPEQIVSATVNHNEIKKALTKVFGAQRPYLILAAANNQGLRPVKDSPRKLAITDEIDKMCDAFFGGVQNVDYYLNINRYETDELAHKKPVLTGCDAHSFEDLESTLGKHCITTVNEKPIVTNSITWIKADVTFEGLKQIVFEPEYRISISETIPRIPTRRIEYMKLNFPTSTTIQRKESGQQQAFCLTNLKHDIYFSDYFTCIIGGRGTGKSTIINFLAEKLSYKTDYFEKSNLLVNGAKYSIEDDPDQYVEVHGTNEIEFISQGQIEKLAEGSELTRLVFNERIRQIESRFADVESDFDGTVDSLDDNIRILIQLISNSRNRKTKTKEKENTQKIIDSINDEKYIAITTRIKALRSELGKYNLSKKSYLELLEELSSIAIAYSINTQANEYEVRQQEITQTITALEELIKGDEITVAPKQFPQAEKRVKEILEELEAEAQKLRAFFAEKGTSEESIKDSEKAASSLARLNSELEELSKDSAQLKAKYSENQEKISRLPSIYNSNEALITENLQSINKKLEVKDDNVLDINFSYSFDEDLFRESLFKEFYQLFAAYHISGTSESRVKEVLFSLPHDRTLLEMNYKQFLAKLHAVFLEENYKSSNNYVKIIEVIFSENGNFHIYLNLLKKHLFNLTKYLKIKGFYGSRELESCSFGQRCTAVIVTLLMTGVKPLIIDEPEAHLDNKLIADYLVGLIKEKQYDRQIIFATHNSNFVVNGDAGLIHILEIPSDNVFTVDTPTTIENVGHRERLLKLEGGREAFLTRESKYGIKN